MTADPARYGLLDTNIMILRSRIAPSELPDEMAISAVTLAELSAGPHEVRPDTEQDAYFEVAERARRLDVLQRDEHEFDPISFDADADADAARAYGRVTAMKPGMTGPDPDRATPHLSPRPHRSP